MTVTKELTWVIFSLFPFLTVMCTQVAKEAPTDNEAIEARVISGDEEDDRWTAEDIDDGEGWPGFGRAMERERGRMENQFENARDVGDPDWHDTDPAWDLTDDEIDWRILGGTGDYPGPGWRDKLNGDHNEFGDPNIPLEHPGGVGHEYDMHEGLPWIFLPGSAVPVPSPGPFIGPPFPMPSLDPTGAMMNIPINPTQYETMYWNAMYEPPVGSNGRQILENDEYGYPVRIPGTTVSIPTPTEFSTLYWSWINSGGGGHDGDPRWADELPEDDIYYNEDDIGHQYHPYYDPVYDSSSPWFANPDFYSYKYTDPMSLSIYDPYYGYPIPGYEPEKYWTNPFSIFQ